MGQSRPGVTLGHSLSTRRLMVVRIGAFRPFRGMAVLSQLPDDRGITNAKVGVGTKLDDKEMGLRFNKSSGSGGMLRQLLDSTFGQICLFVSSPRKIFSNLCLCCLPMPVARRQHPISAVLLLAFPRKQPPSHPRCWTTLYGNPTIGDTATAHGWDARQATPRVSSRIQCVTLPAISGVRQLPVGIPSQVVKRTHSVEVRRESSLC